VNFGAVSSETVVEMAEGAKKVSGADMAIATSGIAGPGGGSSKKPVGTVYIGMATPEGSKGYRFESHINDREKNKILFAMKALDLVRRHLEGLDIGNG
jgi:nicotinamide-nucleotide amidase